MVRFILYCLLLFPFFAAAQIWDFGVPQKLPGNVNTEYEEVLPLLSPDGKTLFFSRILYPLNMGGKFSGSDLWVSTFDNGKKIWGKAINPKNPLNDRGNTAVVGLNKNGETIYLLNTTANKRANGIYFSKKNSNSWSNPELIPIEGLEPGGFLGAYVSPDFDVIFISMKAADSRGEEDIYVTTKSPAGQWSKPKNLGSSVNTSGFEISPFLSADKKRLYFSSNGHKGLGDADIYYCDRLYGSWETWSTARNLGEKLNSKNFDGYFSLYGDSTAYFVSNRKGKYSDIYKVKVIPGDEVLPFGQRYLTAEETAKVLGGPNISRRIVFENNVTELTFGQKELLFFIAAKLEADKEISLQLSVIEENDEKLTGQRLTAVADHFRSAGIENVRLLLSNSDRIKKENKSRAMIEISLFK